MGALRKSKFSWWRHHLGWPTLVYMNSGVFRGNACMCVKDDNFMQMAAPVGESQGIPCDVICTHDGACVYIHTCMEFAPTHSYHYPSTVENPQISKNLINLELMKIIQFCLKIWNLWRPPPPTYEWVYGLLVGWVSSWMGSHQITKNWINIYLIQFCLKIYDLWRHHNLGVGVWEGWWWMVILLTFDFLLKPPYPITWLFFLLSLRTFCQYLLLAEASIVLHVSCVSAT